MSKNTEVSKAAGEAEAAASLNREQIIVRTSIIGILANLFLAGFKAVVGLAAGSIAIVLDAVNNLSDAASSVITIVGTKLAGREADKKHPFGYGRIEYLSAMIISIIVLYAGITSLTESVKKILHPEAPEYTAVTLIIVAAGVIVKIFLGRHVKSVGEKVNSDSLVNSGEDARLDAVISASTLVAAVIFLVSGISLEAWLGAVISLVIIKSGFEMLRDTISSILGERADAQLARDIKATILTFPRVKGVYDLVLNNYGPDSFTGSAHIEVPDTMTAKEIDGLLREVVLKVYQTHQVILTALGIYSYNVSEPEALALREEVSKVVLAHPHVLQMHGFYVDMKTREGRFDLVISFDAADRNALLAEIRKEVETRWPQYRFSIVMDTDFSEE